MYNLGRLLQLTIFALSLPIVFSQESKDYLYGTEETIPIQILKKGHSIMMCLIHPRNCPSTYRKRSSDDIKSVPEKESITKIILQKQRFSILPIIKVLDTLENVKEENMERFSRRTIADNTDTLNVWYDEVR